jgi:hypothetical protein
VPQLVAHDVDRLDRVALGREALEHPGPLVGTEGLGEHVDVGVERDERADDVVGAPRGTSVPEAPVQVGRDERQLRQVT